MYIVDAIKGTDYAYDGDTAGVWAAVTGTAPRRANGQRFIREHRDEIRCVYFVPASN